LREHSGNSGNIEDNGGTRKGVGGGLASNRSGALARWRLMYSYEILYFSETSVILQLREIIGKKRKQKGNQIQGTFRYHSGNLLRTFGEHPGDIQGTFREHSGNIRGTFREHSGNIQ
jgi:hypothetical protein